MRTKIVLIAAASCLAVTSAIASTETACWNRDVERIDHYVTPPEGGDNAFFTTVSQPGSNTNVALVIDAKKSMNYFTERMYDIRASAGSNGLVVLDGGTTAFKGCNYDDLNGLNYFMLTTMTPPTGVAANFQNGYDPNKTYPDPGDNRGTGYFGGTSSDDFTDGLQPGMAYLFGQWPAGPNAGTGAPMDYTTACNMLGVNANAACGYCLSHRGYFIPPTAPAIKNSAQEGIFTTNFLRFHPVKWVLMELAYKRLVQGPLLSQLRESVVVTNNRPGADGGSEGGTVKQMMLPQSCSPLNGKNNGNGTPPIQSKITAIDSVKYDGTNDPLAETLFNTAWYMAGQQNYWIYASDPTTTAPATMVNGKSEPCSHCGGSDFILLFSDGRSDVANPNCVPPSDGGTLAAFCAQPATNCSNPGLGVSDEQYINAAITGTTPPPDVCPKDYAPNVSAWMSNPDGGTITTFPDVKNERLTTIVIALGDVVTRRHGELNVLNEIALKSGTTMTVATDFKSLEDAIAGAFQTINQQASSFSSAAITTVQSQGYTSAFIPRFRPQAGAQWKGSLERLDFFNEFSAGCTPADYGSNDSGTNPNKNNSCYDVYLTDKQGNFVTEDNGQFVQLNPNVAAPDGGWAEKIDPTTDAGVPAVPYWEASDVLTQRVNKIIAGASDAVPRKIYTVAPKLDGTYNPTLIDFTVANEANIRPLLKLGGVDGQLCVVMANLTRHVYSTVDDCATDLIKFIQGYDVMLQNPDNRADPAPSPMLARPNILGDIFHSSPILVTPPAPQFLCDLGVVNQCVPSLYEPNLEPGGGTAYNNYVADNAHRQEFLLVGSNDGMIHAFNAGNYDTTKGTFDTGTGEELWAFIPPEMLPKLVWYMIGDRHSLLVDGTPMVRDIWVDANNDHQKTEDEFHTVAIVGDREGGRHFTGLDVTDPANPKFLWSWPKPGSTEELFTGQSWDDLGPAPAPVGPIAEKDDSGAFSVNGTKARERYVLAAGGGYDPAYLRGRFITFIDAYTGQEVYRFSQSDTDDTGKPQTKLFPVAAPVSMLDTNSDGIFDTAVVGDTGGQVWTISMLPPGHPGATGLYDNWNGGRAFVQYKGDSFNKRSPFFQRAVAAKTSTGVIRVYLGSGDRAQIKDPDGGTCGLANLDACMRKGCSVDVHASTYGVGAKYATSEFAYGGGTTDPTYTDGYDNAADGVACSDSANANVQWVVDCGAGVDAGTFTAQVSCDWGASDAGECPTANGRPLGTQVDAGTPTLVDSRFYSIRLFDSVNRVQDPFNAGTYDSNALTDSDLVNADTTIAGPNDNGWYVNHANSYDERTSSSALLLSGCVVWNTLLPNPDHSIQTDAGTCRDLPRDTAYAYQADAITGAIACGAPGSASADAGVRFTSRSTYVAPQAPAPVVSVNSKTGQVAYGSVSLDPGSPPAATTLGTSDIVAPIHWLEVPRKVHDCRHATSAAAEANCN